MAQGRVLALRPFPFTQAKRRIMTKQEKVAAVITVVWLMVLFPLVLEAPSDGDFYLVTGVWLLPVVIWWGWHWVKRP